MRKASRKMVRIAAALLVVAGAQAAGDDRGLHLAGGRTVGFNWYLSDGAGYRWDISSNGQVSDGTDDAYDGGMQLRLGGTYFGGSQQGTLSPDGREVEIGPWQQESLQVYRRIYVDAKLGYARWIDLFENNGGETKTVTVQYYSNLGGSIATTHTTGGKPELTEKDWGLVTGESGGSSRPAIVHVFASKGAKVRPRARYAQNSDSIYLDYTLKVPGGKTVGICQFQAQRRPFAEAVKFLQEFNPRKELSLVPPGVRRVLANMGGATLLIGDVDLPRHEQHDLALLTDESELLGRILSERFEVETFFGRLDLPAERVVGLSVPSRDDPHVHVILADGQIAAGALLNAPLRIRLTNGNEMSLPPGKLAAATFALSPQRPAEIQLTQPTLVLRCGQHLAFRREDLPCSFQTQYGLVRLDADDLRSLQLDTPEGGLHRAVFRNGSVLSGLLAPEELKCQLELGPVLEARRHVLRQVLFPGADADTSDLAVLTLRNEDQLYGRIAQPTLAVATQYGKVTLKPAEIAELQAPEDGTLGQVQIKLHSGTTVTGKYLEESLQFEVVPGPRLAVYFGHVVQIACPAPTAAPSSRPAGAAPPPSTSPAAAPRDGGQAARHIAELRSVMDELRRLRQSQADLAAQTKAVEEKDGKAAAEKLRKKAEALAQEAQAVSDKAVMIQKGLREVLPAGP